MSMYTTENKVRTEVMQDVEILTDLGIKGVKDNVYTIKINNRMYRVLGRCSKLNNVEKRYTIELSSKFVTNASDQSVRNTIMHEVIHSAPNCMNHGKTWQSICNLVMHKHKEFNLSRIAHYDEYSKALAKTAPYEVICANCLTSSKFMRKTKTIDYCLRGRAKCGKCGSKMLDIYYKGTIIKEGGR